MRKHYTLSVELTLHGPILTVGGETTDPGIDAPMARDRFGRWMLPFSLIKGKVLDAISELRESDFSLDSETRRYFPNNPNNPNNEKLQDWLGLPSGKGSYNPERGRLRFGDFHTVESGDPNNIIERIEIDSDAGAVRGRMLQMMQAPFTYGEEVTFEGKVEFIADDEEAKKIADLIDTALRWTPAYGANRTVGFGRTKKVEITLQKTNGRSSKTPAANTTLPFELEFDRPLCLVGKRSSQNHFESLENVSGTVLKGALARMLQELSGAKGRDVNTDKVTDFPTLRKNFEKIRFSEARPRKSTQSERPVEPPLSIVTCPVKEEGDLDYFDAALEESPRLIHRAAPAFMPDWKDEDFHTVRTAFGWSNLPRERRTRTAISPISGRAADEQLFSYGLVLPDRKVDENTNEKFVWDAVIGIEHVAPEEQDKIREELAAVLSHGFTGIGKTKAVGSIKWKETAPPPKIQSKAVYDKLVIVTLQTDCLMTNPKTLQKESEDPLHDAYAEYWEAISGRSLELKRFFARQSLYGGFVSQYAKGNGNYEPFLLTDRGSVFVLTVIDSQQAQTQIELWANQGLPNAEWLTKRYATNGAKLWERCPYIRENGYGEVAVNLTCHNTHRFPPE